MNDNSKDYTFQIIVNCCMGGIIAQFFIQMKHLVPITGLDNYPTYFGGLNPWIFGSFPAFFEALEHRSQCDSILVRKQLHDER